MSDQNPRTRRKIAGERRPRSAAPMDPSAPAGTTDGPAERTAQRPSSAESATASGLPVPTPAASPFARLRRHNGAVRPGRTSRAAGLGRVPSWLLVGLGAMLALALIFDVYAFANRSDASEQAISTASMTSALRQAPTQAETAAVRVLAYDYKTLQQDADEAKSLMTPDYASKFQKTVEDLLQAPANQVKAHVEADVKASGVVNADPSQVDVMLFVDQTSQTTSEANPQTYLNRVVFRMVKSGDRWLVDDVTAL
jgi:Mce-associated membrane protein